MARRKSKQHIQPAELDLWFDISTPGEYFIDLGQCLSLVNRKFYRQGMQYAVDSMQMFANGVVKNFVYRLPNTWVVANAWEKAMRHWKKQQDETMNEGGLQSTTARYRDFKVFMNPLHAANYTTGATPNTVPDNYLTSDATAEAEWSLSRFVIPNNFAPGNTDEYYGHILGDNATLLAPALHNSKGLVVAYAESRSRPQTDDPNIVQAAGGGLYGLMEDVGDDNVEIINLAQEQNDRPPYLLDQDTGEEYYPGGANQPDDGGIGHLETVMTVRNTAAAGGDTSTTYAPGFLANLGLLMISTQHPDPEHEPGAVKFCVTLAAGPHKGVMARPYQDVN